MDKLASRLNKAVTRAGGGINNQIAAQALKELGWTYDFAERIKELEAALQRYVCRCKDVTATGAQVCTHGIPTTSLCGWEARKALEGKP